MSQKIEGGCLCGAIKYQAELEQTQVMSCHCKDCQCTTGSTCATFVGVPESAMTLEGEPRSYTKKGESGNGVTRSFCGNCGSQLYSTVEAIPGVRFVKIGTLEDNDDLVPGAHIWTASKPSWVELPEGATTFEKQPG